MSKTALIILNYNNHRDTLNCIESIRRHNTAPVKILVVDNGSRPEDLEALRHGLSCTEVTLIETGENLGYGKGNNVGLEAAYADPEISHVMILNNDILFIEDIVPRLLDALDQAPQCAIITPVLYQPGGKEYDLNCARRDTPVGALVWDNLVYYLRRWGGKRQTDIDDGRFILKDTSRIGQDGGDTGKVPALLGGLVEIELPSGSCMLCRKEVMQGLGSFDPATFMYFEENILYRKTQRAGLKNYLLLDCHCVHLGAATTSALPDNRALNHYSKESERYYVRAYTDAPRWLKWLHGVSVRYFLFTFDIHHALKKLIKRKSKK